MRFKLPHIRHAAVVTVLCLHSFCLTYAEAECPPFGMGVQIGQVKSTSLPEISGIAVSKQNPDVLWAHNDSGDTARLFAMNSSGTHLGIYNLVGAGAVDWEDMAIGPGPIAGEQYLYVADTGDNDRNRASITIYRVPEPSVHAAQGPVIVELNGVESLPIRYPSTRYDCETLLVDPITGDIILITRDRANEGNFYVFVYPAVSQTPGVLFTLQPAGAYQWNVQVKGGDVSAQGDMVVLRPHSGTTVVKALWWARELGESPEPLWNVFTKPACLLPLVTEPQGEAIAFSSDGFGYFTISEGTAQPIYLYEWETPPIAPNNIVAVATSSSRIDVSWEDHSDNETGFTIERSTDAVNFAHIGTVAANARQFTDSTAIPATTYYYRVQAYNNGFVSDYSGVASATTPYAPPAPPAAPTSLTARAFSKSQINLTWSDRSNNETGFKIERGLSSGSMAEIGVVGANVKSFSDTGLLANKTYYYRVRAYNAGGSSAYSKTVNTKTLR